MILPKETMRYGEATGEVAMARSGHPSYRHRARRRSARAVARPGAWAGYMVCWMVVVAVSLFLASRQMALANLGYRAEAARGDLALAQRDSDYLRYQVSQLESLSRVEAAARSLGLVPAKQRVAVFTPSGSNAGSNLASAPTSGATVAASGLGKVAAARPATPTKGGILSFLARAVLSVLGKQAEASPGR